MIVYFICVCINQFQSWQEMRWGKPNFLILRCLWNVWNDTHHIQNRPNVSRFSIHIQSINMGCNQLCISISQIWVFNTSNIKTNLCVFNLLKTLLVSSPHHVVLTEAKNCSISSRTCLLWQNYHWYYGVFPMQN